MARIALLLTLLAATLAAALALNRAPEDPGFTLPARVTKVVDGDTVRLKLDSGPLTVRLHGIDAPERDQRHYRAAMKALSALVAGREVELKPVEQDRYDRMVARVYVGRQDVNAAMVEQGYAWAYRQYLGAVRGDRDYCELEAAARAAGRGIWEGSGSRWEAPWDFRARQRGERVTSRDYSRETAADCRAAIDRARRR
jgi:endonuclease YncB( thermonuclease family)